MSRSLVDEEDAVGVSEHGFQAGRSPSNYEPVSQDGDRTLAEMGTGSNTSREPSITGPAPTSDVSTPTEHSTAPTSPASGADWQQEKLADGAGGGASVLQANKKSNEPETIIAPPSSLRATEPITGTRSPQVYQTGARILCEKASCSKLRRVKNPRLRSAFESGSLCWVWQ